MILPDPRTYILKLPEGLYALTGYADDHAGRRDYVFIAMTPPRPAPLRELEKAEAGGARWSPDPRTPRRSAACRAG